MGQGPATIRAPWVQRIREWANETPSVMDRPFEAALRMIARTIGADDPSGQVLGMTGAMETGPVGGAVGALEKLLERVRSRGLYSRVEDVASQLPPGGVHPNRVASLLKSGASQEEVMARRVPEFLAGLGDQPVTPEALRAHLEAHPFGIQVKTLQSDSPYHFQGNEWQQAIDRAEAAGDFDEAERIQRAWEGLSEDTGSTVGQPQYAAYQLPGGEQYQETLLQKPLRLINPEQPEFDPFANNPEALRRLRELNSRTNGPEGDAALSASELAEVRKLRAINAEYRPRVLAQYEPSYQSPHFGPSLGGNLLVHTRSNTRRLATGEKGRFLEEVQSDWHQAGKRGGYVTPETEAAARAAKESAVSDAMRAKTDAFAAMREYADAHGKPASYWTAPDEWRALVDQYNGAAQRLDDATLALERSPGESGVPDAPFKESWPELGLKQQLLEAVEDPEASWFGFTTGDTQVDRYKLSKQVDRLAWDPPRHGAEEGLLMGDKGGQPVFEQRMKPDQLGSVIGREAAQALLAAPAQPAGWHELSGVALDVGGKGMRQFYDQLLPKRLEKIVRPFGGKVERLMVRASEREGAHVPIWGVRLTAAMKERIRQAGLPLAVVPMAVSHTRDDDKGRQ